MLEARILKAVTAPVPRGLNAVRRGPLSRFVVQRWHSRDECQAPHMAVAPEDGPVGPAEEHRDDECAGIVWRKRRPRVTEAAAWRQELRKAASSRLRPEATVGRDTPRAEPGRALTATGRDRRKLRRPGDGVASDGQGPLLPRGRAWHLPSRARGAAGAPAGMPLGFQDGLQPTAERLRQWLERREAGERREATHGWLEHREDLRETAIGLADVTDRLDALARYETHLDRKPMRTLDMLLKLQGLSTTRGAKG